MSELLDFSREFHQEIRTEAHSMDAMREEMFVMKAGAVLEEYGEMEDFIYSPYKAQGMKIDGYHYDDELKDFTLAVALYTDQDDPDQARIPNSEVDKAFRQAKTFFEKSLTGLKSRIDVANEAHELAGLIAECKKEIRAVRIIFITDGIVQRRAGTVEDVNGIQVSHIVWDIERISTYYKTGEREKIVVSFPDYCGDALPCVVRESDSGIYTTYLGFIPGKALADMYGKWGIRMLDMNVRVFLSARGGVNKGIRETIMKSPEMFCSYNNGITAFARSVRTSQNGAGTALLGAEDFQIVNGGQTTASLYHTRRKDRADLESIEVQMKLTVVHDVDRISELVPKISEYSNTQNKVQLADLAANQSPHIEIQSISNSIPAPDPTGGTRQTHWFYERARGSYEELRNLTAKTPAQKQKFDDMRPKAQKFDKLKFAQVWNTYLRQPNLVSLGGQKNFARFNVWLREQQGEDWVKFFKKTVALIILWDYTEKLVRRSSFQGYRHNIVAYTLSWFFNLTDMRLDLDKIWNNQKVSGEVGKALEFLVTKVNTHIRDTDQNVTEYCKKEECWNQLKQKKVQLSDELIADFISGQVPIYNPALKNDEENIKFCTDIGAKPWFTLATWLKERDFLTGIARSQCVNMGRALLRHEKGGTGPSAVLSKACVKIWEEAGVRGWSHEANNPAVH